MDILQTLEYTSKISSIKTASYVSILIQLTSYNMYKNYAFDAVSQLCTQEVLKVIYFTNYKLQRELLPYIHGQ